MFVDGGVVVYSASDLTIAAACEFGLLRRLDAKLGRRPLEIAEDPMRERAARMGDRHEAQLLLEMRERFGPWDPATGRGVAEIARPASYSVAALVAKHAETVEVLTTGADVVFQAGFFDGRFSGWADFVIREDRRYTVHDAKLARRAKVTALLQLAAYADQLISAGVPITEHVSLILGDRTVTTHKTADLLPVYRERRARLQELVDQHAAERGWVVWGDARYRACGRCEVCTPEVEASRDVLLVAGLRSTQRSHLQAAGITTIDDLAVADEVPGIATATLSVLRAQAGLQVAQDPPAPGGGSPTGAASFPAWSPLPTPSRVALSYIWMAVRQVHNCRVIGNA